MIQAHHSVALFQLKSLLPVPKRVIRGSGYICYITFHRFDQFALLMLESLHLLQTCYNETFETVWYEKNATNDVKFVNGLALTLFHLFLLFLYGFSFRLVKSSVLSTHHKAIVMFLGFAH